MFRTSVVASLVALSLFTHSRQAAPMLAGQQTGIITGQLETEHAGARAPVRRAKVILTREGSKDSTTASTDAEARYRFEGLTPGRYVVTAEKPGFVSNASAPIDVTGASRTVDLRLTPGGALEGRLQDDRNAPIGREIVTADRLTEQGAVAASYVAATDDIGRFRVHSLPAGRYRMRSTPRLPASGDEYFYPGTITATDARVITVAPGMTSDRLEFTVPVAPLSAIAAAAIESAAQIADSPAPDPKATRITGTITRSDSGQPIANATVQLTATISGVRNRAARTRIDGTFDITGVPAGTWVLSATATGFVSVDAGVTRPTGVGIRLTVQDGDRVKQDVTLAPTSAIEGRVLDEFGDPAPGVVVQVAQKLAAVGLWRFLTNPTIATTGMTDDRGWFRAPGLFPGDYYLIAVPQPFEKSWMTGFAPTFFPGTTTSDAATPISIIAGRDVYDARFAIRRARTAAVTGQVVDVGGQPVSGQVVNAAGQLMPSGQVLLLPVENGEVRAMVMTRIAQEANGTFRFNDVPEGTYVVQATVAGMFGVTAVTVDAANREPRPTRVTVKPGITARGRVIFDGDVPAPAPETRSQVIAFQPSSFTTGPLGGGRVAVTIDPNWNFEIPGLAWHGVMRVSAPVGWALVSVRHEGRDITDTPSDFQSADVSGLEVVLTNRVGSVSGTVTSGGQPAAKTLVVIMGADDTSWTYLTRTMVNAVTDDRGRFAWGALVPGRYLAVVATGDMRLADHASLLALRSLGVPFTVSERASTVVNLNLPR